LEGLLQIVPWNKKPVAFPGIYSGIPIDRYHSAECCIEPSISSSGLRTIFNKSPKHYWYNSVYNPKRSTKETGTEAKILGQATHHLLLGEQKFLSKFAIRPDTIGNEPWQGNRKACKMWLAAKAEAGLTVVTPDMIERITGMAQSLREEPLVQNGILNGLIEHSIIWKDKETGIWLKSRPDALPNDSADFSDLKTTTSVMWEDLRRSIREFGYFQQAAMVAEGCQQVLGIAMNSFSLVFVESREPYATQIVAIKDGDIQRGIQANRYALRKFADCLSSGKWPGPGEDFNDAKYIEMTEWAQKDIDARIKLGL
jgi:hypothetical protein